jgi:uncharacterized membrane protein YfcA
VIVGLLLASLVGLTLGLFGGGGSVLSVTVLTFALGMPLKAAVAASLLVIGVTSTAAVIAQRSSGLVSIRIGVGFGGAGMVGAFAGGHLASSVPEAVLLTAFGAVMFLTSIGMMRTETAEREIAPARATESRAVHTATALTLALTVGIVTGMLGAGGGLLIVPALVLHGRMPMKRAVATSLLVIALQSFAGFVGHLGHTPLDWAIVVPFTLVASLGGVLGSKLANRAPPELLRHGFACLLLLLAIVVVARELPQAERAGQHRPRQARAGGAYSVHGQTRSP